MESKRDESHASPQAFGERMGEGQFFTLHFLWRYREKEHKGYREKNKKNMKSKNARREGVGEVEAPP